MMLEFLLTNLVDLGRWNIAHTASITATSSSSYQGLIHVPSMELQTAFTKSYFSSTP